jgi:hypothetical protein
MPAPQLAQLFFFTAVPVFIGAVFFYYRWASPSIIAKPDLAKRDK